MVCPFTHFILLESRMFRNNSSLFDYAFHSCYSLWNRNSGAITSARNSRRLEAIVSVERRIFTFDFRSAVRFHHCVLDHGPDLLCIGEYYIIIRSFAGKFSFLVIGRRRRIDVLHFVYLILVNLQSDLLNMTIYDLAYDEDHSELYNLLSNPSAVIDPMRTDLSKVNQICFSCHLKRGGVDYREDVSFELVQFVGYFRE